MEKGVTETFTKTVTIGEHTAIMRLDGDGAFTCDWTPNFPRRLTASELETYRAARAALVALAKKSRYDALVTARPRFWRRASIFSARFFVRAPPPSRATRMRRSPASEP